MSAVKSYYHDEIGNTECCAAKKELTLPELVDLHNAICKKGRDLMESKNHDYAGSRGLFANFMISEHSGICSTETGFLVRMSDKMSRLITYTNKGKLTVKGEGVEDTIVDLINYLILFLGYVKQKGSK